MAATHRRIHGKGPYQTEEYKAGGTITPGMLVKVNSSGLAVAHPTAEIPAVAMFAEEDALQGNEVSDNYTTSSNRVLCILPAKGSVVNVLVASGETIAIGDILVSGGDGTLIKAEAATSGTLNAGALLEATEATSELAANTLIACRVI